MFKTYYPSLVDQSAVPIQKGGTDGVTVTEATNNLSMVTDSMSNKPAGWLPMPAGGIVDPSRLPLDMQSKKVTLDGPLTTLGGTATDYLITNFDSFDQYVFTDVDGTISRVEDVVTFTPLLAGGLLGFKINGWTYVFDVTPVSVNKPFIIELSPTTNLGPYQSFTSSAFSVDGGVGTHVSSDWQLSESNTFSSILPSSVSSSTGDKTTFAVTDLPAGKSLFVRVRYNSQIHGTSEWSDPVAFSTRMSYVPATPEITFPINNATGISSSLTVTATQFVGNGTGVNGPDTMHSAQWEYSADQTFPGASTISTTKLANDTPSSLAVTGLTANISYYVRVRYLSNLGATLWSDWSSVVKFSTAVSFKPGTPSITSPASGALDQLNNLALSSSAFVTSVSDTHQGTSWEVNSNASFTGTSYAAINNSASDKLSVSLLNLPANTTFYARVKHHGVNTGASDWSTVINFKTKAVSVAAPTVNGSATVSMLTPNFTSSAYALTEAGVTLDTHVQSVWELYSASAPTVVVASNIGTAGDTRTSWTVGPGLLTYGSSYIVKVKHVGSTYGESAFSAAFAFSISAVTVNKPVISITGGTTGASLTPSFTSSAFAQTPTAGGLTHIQSSWEVASDAAFSTIVATSSGFVIGGTSTLTSWTVGTGTVNTPLVNGQNYYARLKHTGSGGIESPWSDSLSFGTVGAATIVTPTLSVSGTTSTILSLNAYATNPANSTTLPYSDSYIEISTNSSFSTILTSAALVSSTQQWTVPAGTLVAGQNYFARGKHYSTNLVASNWSNIVPISVASTNLSTAVLTVSTMTWQPLSTNQLTVTVQNAPASIGNLKVQIETQQVGGTWISSGLAADFTQNMPTTSITSGNARSITFNITHSNPGAVDTNWNLRARVYQETLVSNTVTSSSIGPIILKAAAVANNWTATLQGPGSTVGLGMMATFNITLNNAVVGQSYSYSATAAPQGNVSPLPAPTNIGSGVIVATAVNQTYSTNLAFGVAVTNTFASFLVNASVVNNGTTKYPGTTVNAATYTAPVVVNMTGITLTPSSTYLIAYQPFNLAVDLVNAPASAGNIYVDIEFSSNNGSTWAPIGGVYSKVSTTADITSGNNRTVVFSLNHSNPPTADQAWLLRAKATQVSNTSNTIASSPGVAVTLQGVAPVPVSSVNVRVQSNGVWQELSPATLIDGDGGFGYVALGVVAQNLSVPSGTNLIVLITSADNGAIFYSGQVTWLHGGGGFGTDSNPNARIYQIAHTPVDTQLVSPEYVELMGVNNSGVGWGVGFRYYAGLNIADGSVSSQTVLPAVTKQCIISIHHAQSPYTEVIRAPSLYTFRSRITLWPDVGVG